MQLYLCVNKEKAVLSPRLKMRIKANDSHCGCNETNVVLHDVGTYFSKNFSF